MVFDIVFWQILIGFGAAWLVIGRERKRKIGFLKQVLAVIGPIVFCTFATVMLLGKVTQNQLIGIGAAIAFLVAMPSFHLLSKPSTSPREPEGRQG